MPTILLKNGFRSYFYSNENNEPMHVHVEKGEGDGKIWLDPIAEVHYLHNFTNAEIKAIVTIVFQNIEFFKEKWNGHLG